MIWAYARGSTADQTPLHQLKFIKAVLEADGKRVDHNYMDQSRKGNIPWQKRQLRGIINRMQPGDTVYVTEISRLSRNVFELLELYKIFTERKVKLVAIYNGITLDGEDYRNLFIYTISAAFAQLERDMTSERIKKGQRNRKPGSPPIGRPKGSKLKLAGREKEVEIAWTSHQFTLKEMAKKFEVSAPTMRKFLTETLQLQVPYWKPKSKEQLIMEDIIRRHEEAQDRDDGWKPQ